MPVPEYKPYNNQLGSVAIGVLNMVPLDINTLETKEEFMKKYYYAVKAKYMNNCYLLTGPQEGYKENPNLGECIHRVNAVDASTVGAGSKVVDLYSRRNESPINDINVLIFQRK